MTYHPLNTRRRRTPSSASCLPVAGILAASSLALGGIGFSVANALHVEEKTCTVESKDRTTTSDGSSDARVYTEDCGVLHVADSLLSWTWSSSDTYASIDEGETYHFTTRGFRVPFFSMFPNVVEVEETR